MLPPSKSEDTVASVNTYVVSETLYQFGKMFYICISLMNFLEGLSAGQAGDTKDGSVPESFGKLQYYFHLLNSTLMAAQYNTLCYYKNINVGMANVTTNKQCKVNVM